MNSYCYGSAPVGSTAPAGSLFGRDAFAFGFVFVFVFVFVERLGLRRRPGGPRRDE